MYFDMTYVGLVLPAILLTLIASASVKRTFKKYSKQMSSTHITGAQAAERILYANGISYVRVERINGNLTDHYDPRSKVVRLSSPVYDSTSTSAIGVASHEAGHAVQYATGYGPIKLRTAIIPICSVGSRLAVPLIFLGLILSSLSEKYLGVAYAGLLFFALATFFQLVTLPVEFNASRRALASIESQGMLSGEELNGAKKVLSAAAMTYVAALAVSLMQLLRFAMLVGRRRN